MLLIGVSVAYLGLLFAIAFYADASRSTVDVLRPDDHADPGGHAVVLTILLLGITGTDDISHGMF